MQAIGIVAEYNPFHNGHLYQVHAIKEAFPDQALIVVMSGNFVQRGQPAIVDKWQRAKMAVDNGVDLIVELPVQFACQPADYFARGALSILDQLGVTSLSFGAERGQAEDFTEAARFMLDQEDQINQAMQGMETSGQSYPQQLDQVLQDLAPNLKLDWRLPNNLLGLTYTREILANDYAMTIHPLRRQGAGHHDEDLTGQAFASATAIRKAFLSDQAEKAKDFLPEASWQILQAHKPLSWQDYWPYLNYQLQVTSKADLSAIYQMSEGLENRFLDKAREAHDFSSFMAGLKTKRYTHTRLQRLCLYTLLQLKEEEVQASLQEKPPVRLLGMNTLGQAYLREQREKNGLDWVTLVNQGNHFAFKHEIKAGRVYQLAQSDSPYQEMDYGRVPYIKKDR